MEELIYTDSITLDYSSKRKDNDLEEYRISIFDDNMHYLDELYLSKKHLHDLFEGLKNIDLNIEED